MVEEKGVDAEVSGVGRGVVIPEVMMSHIGPAMAGFDDNRNAEAFDRALEPGIDLLAKNLGK